MVKDRVNAIALPTVEDIRRDSDLFLEGTRTNEFKELTKAAMKRGFQTRDAEMNLARLVSERARAFVSITVRTRKSFLLMSVTSSANRWRIDSI